MFQADVMATDRGGGQQAGGTFAVLQGKGGPKAPVIAARLAATADSPLKLLGILSQIMKRRGCLGLGPGPKRVAKGCGQRSDAAVVVGEGLAGPRHRRDRFWLWE